MLRIGLLSDTHNFLEPAIGKYLEFCNEIWHAGDIGTIRICRELEAIKPLVAVYGNIDGMDIRREFPAIQRFTREGVTIFMTHIGGYPAHYNQDVYPLLEAERPRLVICGHTHILRVMNDHRLGHLHINPGAAGRHGFHPQKTIIRFSLDAGNILDLEVIELGRR
ncbi:MAG TPA: metallophosphoesterase family protein [Bacteroidia bacterium]|jgi:putative phosphoesterase|nr:metallophosphoesterase family protein [Bacteroidia bacterium]